MTKMVLRYFFDFMEGQEKWLNRMAHKGYRLKRCGRMVYLFENCQPNEYEYAVEFVADKSYSKSKDYRQFLEDMGFRTFTKNINLNFSLGKVRWRPYAHGMGQIATSPGGYNRELLILEKKRDGKPFQLHTDLDDLISSYRALRISYFWAAICLFGLFAATFIPGIFAYSSALWRYVAKILVGVLAALFIIPAIKYSMIISGFKKESRTNE